MVKRSDHLAIKKRQIRMTYQDTKESFKEVSRYIEKKMFRNEGMSFDERNVFLDAFDDCVLSHGAYFFKFTIPTWGRLDFGNFGNFVHKFTRACVHSHDNKIIMLDPATGKSFFVEYKHCWQAILEKLEEIKTYTLGEATHMSREAEVREEVTTHRVSLEEKLKHFKRH